MHYRLTVFLSYFHMLYAALYAASKPMCSLLTIIVFTPHLPSSNTLPTPPKRSMGGGMFVVRPGTYIHIWWQNDVGQNFLLSECLHHLPLCDLSLFIRTGPSLTGKLQKSLWRQLQAFSPKSWTTQLQSFSF